MTPTVDVCAFCGEPRTDPTARFCAICRYDVVAQAPGPPPRAALPLDWLPSTSPNDVDTSPAVRRVAWQAVVMVDPSLDVDPAPETPCPKDQPAAFFTLDHPEIQIGRRDPRRDVQPEIALYDPGISHRHAVLRQTSDGGIDLYDQRSTNGTDVNGVPVVPDTPHRLHEGDAITLGRWTRIAIRRQQ